MNRLIGGPMMYSLARVYYFLRWELNVVFIFSDQQYLNINILSHNHMILTERTSFEKCSYSVLTLILIKYNITIVK